MTNDKELADKIVALGVGKHQHFAEGRDKGDWYGYDSTGDTATYFVHDWRVAGALMEKAARFIKIDLDKSNGQWYVYVQGQDPKEPVTMNEELSRAINEACVEALSK